MPKQIAMVGEGSTGGRPLIQNSITGFCSIVCWFLQHHMRAHSSSCCAGAVVAAATLGGGVTVAAALSSGRLLIHTLADAAPSSGSEAEQLHYALEADVALPDAPTCLAALSSMPSPSFAVGCGGRHAIVPWIPYCTKPSTMQ